jgi:hypothetical protein
VVTGQWVRGSGSNTSMMTTEEERAKLEERNRAILSARGILGTTPASELRERRLSMRLSQADVARRAGTYAGAVSRAERGQAIDWETLQSIREALGLQTTRG